MSRHGRDETPRGNSGLGCGLQCRHDVGGDATGDKEERLGVPFIPERAGSRSRLAGWCGERHDAADRPHATIVAAAWLSIVALAGAVVVGAIPLAGAAAVALLVPAAVVDIEQHRLPDVWVAVATAVLVVALATGPATEQPLDGRQMFGGALAMGLPVLAMHLLSPASMGFGDVKAAAVLGAAVGTVDWRLGAVALCLAALAGGVFGLSMRRRSIPFGPFLVFGAWFALLSNGPIITGVFVGGTP